MRKRQLQTARSIVLGLGCAGSVVLHGTLARADIELVKTDDVSVFVTGRMQAFLNYNIGDGLPKGPVDANGSPSTIRGGEDTVVKYYEPGEDPNVEPGTVEQLRVRTGFTGNVLGFGFRHALDETNEVMGFTAVTTIIESPSRRKYLGVEPDWRESFLKVKGDWGSLVAGRTLVLFNRGATETTFLYGYRYGLGWPGSTAGNGPTAGNIGFGVLANGFGAGFAYATPNMAGAQVTVGIYDANSLIGSGDWEGTKLPRVEAEATYESSIGDSGMFKLFVNGAHQRFHKTGGFQSEALTGIGLGGRVEVGPVGVGLSGHSGTGVGINYALEATPSLYNTTFPDGERLREVDGGAVHLRLAPSDKFDFMATGGITRIHQRPGDKVDVIDHDNNPLTPAASDNAGQTTKPTGLDSVPNVPMKHQLGIGVGGTYHLSTHLHVTGEYFRAMFQWHLPSPAPAGAKNTEQNFDVVNLGLTYDF